MSDDSGPADRRGTVSTAGRTLLTLTAALLATGGACRPEASRDCGVFDHPLAQTWLPYREGDRLVFGGPNAGGIGYVVTERTLNEPFVQFSETTSDSADVGCPLTADYLLEATDDTHGLLFRLLQNETVELSAGEESLSVRVFYRRSLDSSERSAFAAGLRPFERGSETERYRATPSEDLSILGQRFGGRSIAWTATSDFPERGGTAPGRSASSLSC